MPQHQTDHSFVDRKNALFTVACLIALVRVQCHVRGDTWQGGCGYAYIAPFPEQTTVLAVCVVLYAVLVCIPAAEIYLAAPPLLRLVHPGNVCCHCRIACVMPCRRQSGWTL